MTPKLTLLLVDDHKLLCEGLANYLKSLPQVKDVFTAYNSDDAFALLEQHSFDVAIVDLQLNKSKCDGFEICKHIKIKHIKTVVAILSMYEYDYCVERAKQSGANAYFGKNVEFEVLRTFIVKLEKFKPGMFVDGRAVSNGKAEPLWVEEGLEIVEKRDMPKLVVTNSDGIKRIDLNDIMSVEASNSQSVIHTRAGSGLEKEIVVSMSLKKMEGMLASGLFKRVHKSWIVHLKYVEEKIKKGDSKLKLINHQLVPLARRWNKTISAILTAFDKKKPK
jgi:DNA-binding LytR/AlgR family response regulator